jgi:hypothetical protein
MSFTALLGFLFGCHHSNLSRVFTIRRRTYRVCCDCGTEFDYSLNKMAIERQSTQAPARYLPQEMGAMRPRAF